MGKKDTGGENGPRISTAQEEIVIDHHGDRIKDYVEKLTSEGATSTETIYDKQVYIDRLLFIADRMNERLFPYGIMLAIESANCALERGVDDYSGKSLITRQSAK